MGKCGDVAFVTWNSSDWPDYQPATEHIIPHQTNLYSRCCHSSDTCHAAHCQTTCNHNRGKHVPYKPLFLPFVVVVCYTVIIHLLSAMSSKFFNYFYTQSWWLTTPHERQPITSASTYGGGPNPPVAGSHAAPLVGGLHPPQIKGHRVLYIQSCR